MISFHDGLVLFEFKEFSKIRRALCPQKPSYDMSSKANYHLALYLQDFIPWWFGPSDCFNWRSLQVKKGPSVFRTKLSSMHLALCLQSKVIILPSVDVIYGQWIWSWPHSPYLDWLFGQMGDKEKGEVTTNTFCWYFLHPFVRGFNMQRKQLTSHNSVWFSVP